MSSKQNQQSDLPEETYILAPGQGSSGRAEHTLEGPLSRDYIGRGAHAIIYRVQMLLRHAHRYTKDETRNRKVTMAMKVYSKPENYEAARNGYKLLLRSVRKDPDKGKKLINTFRFDDRERAIFMTYLNGKRKVVSVNKNQSAGRDQLHAHPLGDIPNFDTFYPILLDDLERRGKDCVSVAEDGYFVFVDPDGSLDYLYADLEGIAFGRSRTSTIAENLLEGVLMLSLFLSECERKPMRYLPPVIQEVRRRLQALEESATRDEDKAAVLMCKKELDKIEKRARDDAWTITGSIVATVSKLWRVLRGQQDTKANRPPPPLSGDGRS